MLRESFLCDPNAASQLRTFELTEVTLASIGVMVRKHKDGRGPKGSYTIPSFI